MTSSWQQIDTFPISNCLHWIKVTWVSTTDITSLSYLIILCIWYISVYHPKHHCFTKGDTIFCYHCDLKNTKSTMVARSIIAINSHPINCNYKHTISCFLTWWARQIKSRSCLFKNLLTTSAPNVNETPLSFSPQPCTSLSGSDHSRSHSKPDRVRIENILILSISDNPFIV